MGRNNKLKKKFRKFEENNFPPTSDGKKLSNSLNTSSDLSATSDSSKANESVDSATSQVDKDNSETGDITEHHRVKKNTITAVNIEQLEVKIKYNQNPNHTTDKNSNSRVEVDVAAGVKNISMETQSGNKRGFDKVTPRKNSNNKDSYQFHAEGQTNRGESYANKTSSYKNVSKDKSYTNSYNNQRDSSRDYTYPKRNSNDFYQRTSDLSRGSNRFVHKPEYPQSKGCLDSNRKRSEVLPSNTEVKNITPGYLQESWDQSCLDPQPEYQNSSHYQIDEPFERKESEFREPDASRNLQQVEGNRLNVYAQNFQPRTNFIQPANKGVDHINQDWDKHATQTNMPDDFGKNRYEQRAQKTEDYKKDFVQKDYQKRGVGYSEKNNSWSKQYDKSDVPPKRLSEGDNSWGIAKTRKDRDVLGHLDKNDSVRKKYDKSEVPPTRLSEGDNSWGIAKTRKDRDLLGHLEKNDSLIKKYDKSEVPPTRLSEGYISGGIAKTWKDRDLLDRSFEKVDKEYKKFQEETKSNDEIKFVRVSEIEQDLFTMAKEYSLAHCVAEDMRMGSGIALNFKRDFKDIDILLNQRQKQGGLALLEQETADGIRYIYYLVTKRVSTGKPTYETLWSSLKKMRDHIIEKDVKKLAIPRLGCGLDRLEWSRVKHMLEFLFRDVDIEIIVCNFQQTDDSPDKPLNHTIKVVHVQKSIADIEEETSIIYLSTEDGHVSTEMEQLSKKFQFLGEFKGAQRKLGDLIKYQVPKKFFVLYGCIVRKTINDPFDYISFLKCIQQINKNCKKEEYYYVGIQTIKDDDALINDKIITILRNYLRNIDVYICWDGDLVSQMPPSRD